MLFREWESRFWPSCGEGDCWWEGAYEGTCILIADHNCLFHYNGLSFYDSNNHRVDLDYKDALYIISIYGSPITYTRDPKERNNF